MSGADLIAAERLRQTLGDYDGGEFYDDAHDDHHDDGALLLAAFCYLGDLVNGPHALPSVLWPWEWDDWKPTPDDPIRQLVKAAALIAAEIDRLARRASENKESEVDES